MQSTLTPRLHPMPAQAPLTWPHHRGFARPGDELANPVTGHRATVGPRTAGADGGAVEIEFQLPPRSAGAPWHVHTHVTETFTVEVGQLMVEVGERGHTVLLEAGETLTVTPGTPHGFRNAADTPVVFHCAATPGAGFENFVRCLYGLACAGRTDQAGTPSNFWHLALILRLGDVYVPAIPVGLQRLVLGVVVRLARRAGAEHALAPYCVAGIGC